MSTKPNTNQITYDSGANKQDLNDILDTVFPIADYTALRNYTGRATQVRITTPGIYGFFYKDTTDTTSLDNGGTIIRVGSTVDINGVITQGTGAIWKRIFDGPIMASWFGVVGNGVANDTAATQAWLNTLRDSSHSGATGNMTIKIYSQIQIPHPSFIDFSGSLIDCSAITNGTAVKFLWSSVLSPSSNLIGRVQAQYRSLNLKGRLVNFVLPDQTYNTTAMEVGLPIGTTSGATVQNTAFPNLKIEGFKRNIEFLTQTWCLWFDNPFIGAAWDCALSCEIQKNSGENFRFKGGTIFNCRNASVTAKALNVVSTMGEAVNQTSFYFDGTSFDYNDFVAEWEAIEGQLLLNGCHIENDNSNPFIIQKVTYGHNLVVLKNCTVQDNSAQAGGIHNGRPTLFKVTGSSIGTFKIEGGVFSLYGRGPYVFDTASYTADKTKNLSLTFDPGHLITGGGTSFLDGGYHTRFASTSQIIQNGGFETGNTSGWSVGVNTSIAAVTSADRTPYIGNYCGKFTSTVNYGTYLDSVPIAVRGGKTVMAVAALALASATAGFYCFLRLQFFDSNGNSISTVDSTVIQATDPNPTTWKQRALRAIAPAGSAYVKLIVRFSNLTVAYVDGVDCFVLG